MHTIHVQALCVLFCNPFVLHKKKKKSFISACQAGAMLAHSLQKESRKQFTHAVIYTLTHMPTLFMMTQTQNASVHGSVFVTFISMMSCPSKPAYKYRLVHCSRWLCCCFIDNFIQVAFIFMALFYSCQQGL